MNADNVLAYFTTQANSAGSPQGPKLRADLFIPSGVGLVWIASDGKWWQERLKLNADGTTWYDENGRPTTELVEIMP